MVWIVSGEPVDAGSLTGFMREDGRLTLSMFRPVVDIGLLLCGLYCKFEYIIRAASEHRSFLVALNKK